MRITVINGEKKASRDDANKGKERDFRISKFQDFISKLLRARCQVANKVEWEGLLFKTFKMDVEIWKFGKRE